MHLVTVYIADVCDALLISSLGWLAEMEGDGVSPWSLPPWPLLGFLWCEAGFEPWFDSKAQADPGVSRKAFLNVTEDLICFVFLYII